MGSNTRRQWVRMLGTTLLALGVAGCNDRGGGDGDAATPSGTGAEPATDTPTETPSATLTPMPTTTSYPTPTSQGPTGATSSPRSTASPSRTPASPSSTPPSTPPPSTPSSGSAPIAAGDGDSEDGFGAAVALSTDTAVLGAPGDEDPNGKRSGSAYVFERSDAAWRQQEKLVAGDGDSNDTFGSAVALAGDTLLVGAAFDEDPHGIDGPGGGGGSAYVFTRSDGTWRQQEKLAAGDGDSTDGFGAAVSLSEGGDTAVVGAPLDEDPYGSSTFGQGGGSAYVFARSDGAWRQQEKLAAADGDSADGFGVAVAVDGGTALLGAAGDEDPNGERAGSAYVFERSDSAWSQRAKLASEDGDASDFFGAVALEGSTALIGASGDEHPNGDKAGSAYVFERSNGTWRQQTKLAAADGDDGDRFGTQVALAGDTALVGAPVDEDPNGSRGGAAYRFVRSADGWRQAAKLTAPDGDSEDLFGASLGVSRAADLVGARGDEDPNGEAAGSAYVFDRQN